MDWFLWGCVGLTVAAIVVALYVIPGRRGRLLESAVSVLLVLTCIWIGVRYLTVLAPGRGFPGWCDAVLVPLSELLGGAAHAVDGRVLVRYPREVVALQPSWFDLGIPVAAGGLVGTRVLGWVLGLPAPRGRVLVGASLTAAVLVYLRHAVLVMLNQLGDGYFTHPHPRAHWHDQNGVVALLAFGILMLPSEWVFARRGAGVGERKRLLARDWVSGVASVAAVGAASFGWAFVAPSPSARTRVLVDDAHTEAWELGGVRFTPEWRGDMSVYACSAAMEALGGSYHVRVHRQGKLGARLLEDVDILVLKVPQVDFTEEEVADILSYVRAGGRVLAVGDHTDLFGANRALNRITSAAGIVLEPTAVQDWAGTQAGISRGWGMPGVEPSAPDFSWLTGCSLRIQGSARPVCVYTKCFADDAVWANRSYFGDGFAEPAERVEACVLAAVGSYGDGYILAVGDGTILANFAVFLPGRFEFLERCMRFLSVAAPRRAIAQWALTACALVSLGLFIRMCSMGPVGRGVLVLLAVAAVPAGIACADRLQTGWLRPPNPVIARPRAAFLARNANYHLAPTIGASSLPLNRSFDTLFVEVQRFGLRPVWERDLHAALDNSRALIIPNLVVPLTGRELDDLAAWVRSGGVLLLGGCRDEPRAFTAVDEMARALVLGYGDRSAPSLDLPTPHAEVRGSGWEIVTFECGRGAVTTCKGAEKFSRELMGHPFRAPDAANAELYDGIDALFSMWAARLGIDATSRFGSHHAAGGG